MDFRQRDSLIDAANKRLKHSKANPGRLALIFAGAVTAALVVQTLSTNLLQGFLAETGGLSGIGTRVMLETAITIVQTAVNLALPFWTFGYMLCILGVVRGRQVEPKHLLTGFRLFGPVLRLHLYRGIRFFLLAMLSIYPTSFLYGLTPQYRAVEQMLNLTQMDGDIMGTMLALDETAMQTLSAAMVPMLGLYLVVYLLLAAPVFYNMRLADQALMDDPRAGALAAVRRSTVLMSGNRMEMFKLDLRFWWYYLLEGVTVLAGNLPGIGILMGYPVPMEVSIGCFVIYLVMQFGLWTLARNRVEAAVAMAYEALIQPAAGQSPAVGEEPREPMAEKDGQ
jgi:uncharacterized membrane protein